MDATLEDIIRAVEERDQITQAEVAGYYASLIVAGNKEWTGLNMAIKSHWSLSGLKRVKSMAWKRVKK